MVYMGSKRKYCKDIVPIIQQYIDKNNIKNFIDCFCGGANLADKINCKNIFCNDLSPTLIALHTCAKFNFDTIPIEGSRQYWDKAYKNWKQIQKNLNNNDELTKNIDMPFYEIGAIEWYGSFSNRGFPGGYAKPSHDRNYYKEAYNNHKKQAENPNYKKIIFIQGDYKQVPIKQNTILYCDAPYKNTKPYGISPKFNYEEYYNWLNEIAYRVPIFISEQSLPESFDQYIIWSKDNVKRTNGLDNSYKACEKLYLIDKRS